MFLGLTKVDKFKWERDVAAHKLGQTFEEEEEEEMTKRRADVHAPPEYQEEYQMENPDETTNNLEVSPMFYPFTSVKKADRLSEHVH